MQDGSLSNKMNPFLAGITGLGEGLLQGYLTRRKMDEEQNQFNQKMAMEQRQNDLENEFKRADDVRMGKVADAQIANYNSEIQKRDTPQPYINSYENGYTETDTTTGKPKFTPFQNTPKTGKTIKALIPGTNNYGEYDPIKKDFVKDANNKPLIVDINKPTKETPIKDGADFGQSLDEINKLIQEEEGKGFLGDPTTIRQLKIEKIRLMTKQSQSKKATNNKTKNNDPLGIR